MKIDPPEFPDKHDLCSDDFIRAYTLDAPYHEFISNEYTIVKTHPVIVEWNSTARDACYEVNHFLEDETKCLEQIRQFCYDYSTCSRRGTGRIAFRFRFSILEKAYKRNRLATTILAQEEEFLFSVWGADEIQALVIGEGFLAWTDSRFQYRIKESHFRYLKEECERIWEKDGLRPVKINSISDFPKEYWNRIHKQPHRRQTIFYKTKEAFNGYNGTNRTIS